MLLWRNHVKKNHVKMGRIIMCMGGQCDQGARSSVVKCGNGQCDFLAWAIWPAACGWLCGKALRGNVAMCGKRPCGHVWQGAMWLIKVNRQRADLCWRQQHSSLIRWWGKSTWRRRSTMDGKGFWGFQLPFSSGGSRYCWAGILGADSPPNWPP